METRDAPPTGGPFRFAAAVTGRPASVPARVVAWAIDWVILAVAAAVITWLLSLVHGPGLGWPLSAALSLAYWTYFWGSTGQTLGYRVMRIRAVTLSGERLGYAWAFLRGLLVNLSLVLCLVPALISLVMMAATEKHEAIHDLLLGTTVVGA